MQYRGKIQSDYDLVNKKYVDNKASSVLPAVTSSDNGKILKVVSGEWSSATDNSIIGAKIGGNTGASATIVNKYAIIPIATDSAYGVVEVDTAVSASSSNPVTSTGIKTYTDSNFIKSIKIDSTALSKDSNGAVTIPVANKSQYGVVKMYTTDSTQTITVLGNDGKEVSAPSLGKSGSTFYNQILPQYLPTAGSSTKGAVIVDNAMSASSTNPVQNSVVKAYIDNAIAGGASFQGTVTKGTDISNLTNYKAGWYWVVQTAGTYVGQTCEVGDMIYCISNYNSAYSASDFSVVQKNVDMTLYWAKSELTAISAAEIDTLFA